MKEVRIILTEVGKVPVTIEKVIKDGIVHYEGKIMGENNIFIETETEDYCLDQLRKAFELSMHFWLRFELNDLHLNYMGGVKKDWYNER